MSWAPPHACCQLDDNAVNIENVHAALSWVMPFSHQKKKKNNAETLMVPC